MGYPGRQNIYDSTIRRMVQEALEQQEQEFLLAHETDTNEQLLDYLRTCAVKLNHTPWPEEILGGSVILARFGSWERALALAKLPEPKTLNQSKNFVRIRQETEKQKEVYRQRKAEKKVLSAKRRAVQDAKRKKFD
jgi:hypothetical protein